MANNTQCSTVPVEEMERQREFETLVGSFYSERYEKKPRAFVHVYGCQQNVSDGEHIKGMLVDMGYELSETEENADAVIFVTCAVREHAEDRVFGNVGALKKLKAEKPRAIIALCGCMVQQPHIAERLKKSYPYVDLIFGTHVLHRLPEFIYNILMTRKRMIVTPQLDGVIAEGLPAVRGIAFKGFLPVMYGCNNFCTYCVVPYVRGRERSREPDAVLDEAKRLIDTGCRDITLLGQNVNSYGKTLQSPQSFAELLHRVATLPGDFRVRFMTSHPKDCTHELLEVMAQDKKIAKHLHLPVQSGSDRILKLMNRHYTREKYLSLIEYARSVMPEISLTSDIIVGFPGETYEDFCETLSLIDEVRYTSLFTFIFSPRNGTPAAGMDDPVPEAEKKKWFNELLEKQEEISSGICKDFIGKSVRVLCDGLKSGSDSVCEGRTEGNLSVEFAGRDGDAGEFKTIKITDAGSFILRGTAQNDQA